MNPDDLHAVCKMATEKIQEYVRLLITAGAQIICVLEPSAVMLSPDQFVSFSGTYVNKLRKLVSILQYQPFITFVVIRCT